MFDNATPAANRPSVQGSCRDGVARPVGSILARLYGQSRFGRHEVQAQAVGNRPVGHLPAMYVQTVREMRIESNGAESVAGKGQTEGKRCVVQGLARRQRHGTRHVGHAIMNDTIDFISGFFVGRWLRGLKASTLIDCDVHQHSPAAGSRWTGQAKAVKIVRRKYLSGRFHGFEELHVWRCLSTQRTVVS